MRGIMNSKLGTLLIVLHLLALSAIPLAAQQQDVDKVGTAAAAFLRIPVGVKGTAMGSAYVSIADDASAMFWNPSGIARTSALSVFFDHSPWLPGISFNYVGLVVPLQEVGSLGFNVTAMTTAEMDITTIDQPMGTGETFAPASFAFGVTYARNLTDRFSIGANVKFIRESILNSHATGMAIDIGTLYDTPFPGVRLGVSISNFGTDLRMDGDDLNIRVDLDPSQQGDNQSIVGRLKTDNFDAPLLMRVGLSWDALQMQGNRLTLAVDGLNPNDNAQSVNVGAEYAVFSETLILRGGYNDLFLEDREWGVTLGASINFETARGMGFAGGYAFQDSKNLGSVNRFSVELRF